MGFVSRVQATILDTTTQKQTLAVKRHKMSWIKKNADLKKQAIFFSLLYSEVKCNVKPRRFLK